MLINLRNALMSGKRLPYDAEVEYIESTGTQWIDSEIIGAPDVIVEATFAWGNGAFAADNTLIGSNTGANRFIPITTNAARRVQIGAGNTWVFAASSILYDKNTVYTARAELVSGAVKFILDGTQVISTTSAISNTNLAMYIFTSHEGLANRRAHAKLYSMKIYQNGVLVRDYIPVRKGTVGYLYDRVSGKLFGNAGSGDFVLGPDVVPVEYIESHGTEWIDTGFKTTSDSTIEISAAVSNFVNGNIIFGSKGTDATTLIRLLEYVRNEVSILSLQSGAFGVTAGGYITADTNFHKYLITPSGASIDDSIGYQKSRTSNTETNFVLFAYVSATDPNNRLYSQSKIAYAKILQGTTPVRSFRPVRVGTDATSWEGAMMDTLTRRIYRNAGTGAFTYGNDLKYPIPAS